MLDLFSYELFQFTFAISISLSAFCGSGGAVVTEYQYNNVFNKALRQFALIMLHLRCVVR